MQCIFKSYDFYNAMTFKMLCLVGLRIVWVGDEEFGNGDRHSTFLK